ncbi:hypothetical protein PVAG01_08002 [Phlyctema vagabunda]|uniref:Uncharacterized protein n=1 Tax=Phlyctema vagabunda TaxID=108571 RepID=A0ABR4PE03_9HELO
MPIHHRGGGYFERDRHGERVVLTPPRRSNSYSYSHTRSHSQPSMRTLLNESEELCAALSLENASLRQELSELQTQAWDYVRLRTEVVTLRDQNERLGEKLVAEQDRTRHLKRDRDGLRLRLTERVDEVDGLRRRLRESDERVRSVERRIGEKNHVIETLRRMVRDFGGV